MRTSPRGGLRSVLLTATTFILSLASTRGWAQGAVEDAMKGSAAASSIERIGRVHDNLRRSMERHTLSGAIDDLYGDYSRFKNRVQSEAGVQWAVDASFMQQWGVPDGGSPALQSLITLSFNWDIFQDKTWGAGSVQFAGNHSRYLTSANGFDIGSNLGMVTPVNDWPVNQRQFAQLTYTHTLPGLPLSISIGQFPFYNFDGNQYLNNQQQNFVNYALAQNGSATYAAAGLGGYAQCDATETLAFALGFQYPNSASAATLTFPGFGFGEFSWFGYVQWSPKLRGLGAARYSVTFYEAPAVPQEPATRGWSINAVQNLDDKWAVFGRANGASEFTTPIKASYALGFAMNDPIRRHATDQIGVAFAYADTTGTQSNPANPRNEKILEAYWNWTFFGGLLLTPDVQFVLDPAVNPDRASVWILSLRATLMF